ncbi:FadR/GntR family transcriptional regulator [Poseidonocella sp. HB161398]|uniref:FadR/GntR family transcriptional regulator n=1 Tax=Poseidonocella sp. HB161398 TaxID=2320855 RepID=UPI001108FE16|nr:FadR/GntR family transcriptional regulator [Poseidonocella sp. HB161398]
MSEQLFDPVDHDSVADSVVAQIEDMLVAGILKEGTRLPSERNLAELMDVSRPKLREALKRLEEAGLIVTRHGEGTFVAALTGQAMSPALIDLYARHPVAFFDYLEYRRTQEAFAARLAAERATAPDREIIRACMERLRQTWVDADDQGSREADAAFHSAVVDASHNRTLIHMMGSIFQLTRQGVFYNRHFLQSIDGSGKLLVEQHLAIGEAILAGEPEAAEAAAVAHIDFVERSFRKGLQAHERETVARKRSLLLRDGG